MKVLVLACLIAAASAVPNNRLGTEKCTWGPAYWCVNYKQATECNAIQHCKTHVWKSNDMCGDCKNVVTEVNSFAKNNGTEVLKLMNEICTLVGSLADECKAIVQLYGQTILNTVVELTADSQKLCQELGLCPKKQELYHRMLKVFFKQLARNQEMMRLKSSNADYCEDCKLALAEVKDLLQDKSIQNDLIALLEKLCAEFGSYGTECKSIVDQYGPLVFQELASLLDPASLCAEIGLCNKTKKVVTPMIKLQPAKLAVNKLFFPMAPGPVLIDPKPAKPVKETKKVESPKASVECIVCEFAMKELDGILGQNATKQEIEEALDEVCSLLPQTIRSECDSLVEQYGPMIIQLLLQELQPSQICTELGLCSSKKKLERVSLRKGLKANGELCELCKLVVQYLDNALKSNATEEEIKEALEKVCNMLPSTIKTECDAIVEQYGPVIIKIIAGEISPQEVCQALKLCTAGVNGYVKNKCYLGESYWCANAHNALKCQDEISQKVAVVCSQLPLTLSLKCFMQIHKSEKKSAMKNQSPKHWCKILYSYKNIKLPGSVNQEVHTKACNVCKDVLSYLGHSFYKNTTEDQVISAMKAYCFRFKPVVMEYCQEIVKNYGDIIAKILLGKVDPETFCEKLKMCKPIKNPWLDMKCYLGKSYWCASYQNALQCQALERCQITT